MKILIKYPSRSRPERFFDGLDSIYNTTADPKNVHVFCTFDSDDETMNNADVKSRLAQYKNLTYGFGTSMSKVDAINRDMEYVKPYDILLVFSDDMRFVVYGWDTLVREAFKGESMDMLVHFPDQDAGQSLATMYIAGKPFYEHFGYIYNPVYKSLYCDNEIMAVAQAWGKYKLVNHKIFHHLCPAYGHLPKDELFNKQQEVGYANDRVIYEYRKSNGFFILNLSKPKSSPVLTIMLPTTVDRRELFLVLLAKISRQVAKFPVGTVEVIWEEDDKELSIGAKRQKLLERARGTFVVGIDSDDDISDDYLNEIIGALVPNPEVDHVGFYEYCTFDGINPKRSIFSIKYKHWAENIDGHDYIRCANPKSVIRREKALQVGFCECRYGEDIKFSEAVTPLLKTEVFIPKDLYLYKYRTQEHNKKYGIK